MKTLTALAFSAITLFLLTLSTGALTQEQAQEQTPEQRTGSQPMSQELEGLRYNKSVLGMTVKHRGTGAGIGVIWDLIIDEDGLIIGALVTTGNLMGLGGKEIGMEWGQLEHTIENGDAVFYVDVDRATLWDAPEHERDTPANEEETPVREQ